MYTLEAIHLFPIKSLGGCALSESRVTVRGLEHDRRWMLTDPQGRFLTQREIPQMVHLKTEIQADALIVYSNSDRNNQITLSLYPDWPQMPNTSVKVWSDRVSARRYNKDVNDWFSDQLSTRVRLVYMSPKARRRTDGRYAPKGQYVGFSDGFPYLLLGEASLMDLNSRLEQKVGFDRFRPNLIFSGGEPYEEERWSDVRIGNVDFRGVKPCGRCIIITTDQENGERTPEPLRTLATYKKVGNKVIFGQNTLLISEEKRDLKIRVGDAIEPVFS